MTFSALIFNYVLVAVIVMLILKWVGVMVQRVFLTDNWVPTLLQVLSIVIYTTVLAIFIIITLNSNNLPY